MLMSCLHRSAWLSLATVALALAVATVAVAADPPTSGKPLRAGIIGTDTSHVSAFTKALNDPKATGDLADVKMVAAFPGGSPDIPSSADRVQKYADQLREMNVEIVDSIDELLKRVDVVFLESVDGRPHLAQARPVIAAGKPLFIDKPMAASLADAMEIFRLAKEKNVPVFSSSSLRFSAQFQEVHNKTSKFGDVKSCTAWGPYNVEEHHPDLFWYGIHGVEILFTCMGTGCKTVTREAPEKVVGVWADGRVGTYVGKKGYGADIVGTKESGTTGKYDGYVPLVIEICKFFKTGVPPVSPEETLEILAFMEAADQSKLQGGAPVTIESVMANARQKIGCSTAAGEKK
jgi:hypothetical protein